MPSFAAAVACRGISNVPATGDQGLAVRVNSQTFLRVKKLLPPESFEERLARFDDVLEFLGPERAQDLVHLWNAQVTPKEAAIAASAPDLAQQMAYLSFVVKTPCAFDALHAEVRELKRVARENTARSTVLDGRKEKWVAFRHRLSSFQGRGWNDLSNREKKDLKATIHRAWLAMGKGCELPPAAEWRG